MTTEQLKQKQRAEFEQLVGESSAQEKQQLEGVNPAMPSATSKTNASVSLGDLDKVEAQKSSHSLGLPATQANLP